MLNGSPLAILTKAIGACAFFIFLATQLSVFNHVQGITYSMNGGDRQKDPLAPQGITVTNNRVEHNKKLMRTSYIAAVRHGDIEAYRRINFSAVVPIRDLLEPGEESPDSNLAGVFAQSRAIFYAQEECQRIKLSLAKECAVDRATGKLKDGKAHISATLKYTQRTEFGVIDDTTPWVFNEASINLTDGSMTAPQAQGARKRQEFYKKAVRECALIKKRSGNCAITGMRISTYAEPNSTMVRMSASADYGFLTRSR